MSATNRGAVRSPRDFYATPSAAFLPLMPAIIATTIPEPGNGGAARPVWEPAAGDRRLIRWMQEAGMEADGDDLSNGYDYLQDQRKHRPVVITNPPFSQAMDFCEHALNVTEADHVFMLLRLNFLGAQKRRSWWRENEPDAIFVLSERPTFTGDGKTDACEYGWFYWAQITPRHKGIFHL